MDLTHEEKSNRNNSDLHLSILLKNDPENKTGILRDYRQRMSTKVESSLASQNNDVLIAIQRLVDSSNDVQASLSLEIEKVLLSELESYRQEIDKQKILLNNLEKELIQKREDENAAFLSIKKLKEEHQIELTKLSAHHQKETRELTEKETRELSEKEKIPSLTIDSSLETEQLAEVAELYQKQLTEAAELREATELYQKQFTEKTNEELLYKLIGWPDFNDLTQGNKIIPLATRLMAQQMSLKQMEYFLGGPTEKEKLLLFIDELSSMGLLMSTYDKEEPKTIINKPETNNRLQLFKRIRSSLGIQ